MSFDFNAYVRQQRAGMDLEELAATRSAAGEAAGEAVWAATRSAARSAQAAEFRRRFAPDGAA